MADIPVTPGSGANVATNTLTRDGVTEHIQLVNVTDTTGTLVQFVDGTDASGIAQDAGGVGSRGWLSSMVKNLRLIASYLSPYRYYPIQATSGGTVANYIVGIVNNLDHAENETIDLYDGTNTSGVLIASVGALGPTQVITFPAPGFPLASGNFYASIPAALTGSVQILYK